MRESVARHLAQHVSQGNMKSREQAGPQGLVDRHPVLGERTWAKAYPENRSVTYISPITKRWG
jgi:hypothetical protein